MRAIRTVVDATYLVAQDPGLAYTLFVASLESLAQTATAPDELWDWANYDPVKRALIEPALEGLDLEQADRVRAAVLAADQLSLGRRFRSFTLDHVGPSFYRAEAVGASEPIRASDLLATLSLAYGFRSKNVHTLEVLPPERWMMAGRADTSVADGRRVLSLEGLNRLCRHVIAEFVWRSPAGIDPKFNYRDNLPGTMKVRLASQYWAGHSETFTVDSAPVYLGGVLRMLLGFLSGTAGQDAFHDMTEVLAKIEKLLPELAKPTNRVALVAIYALLHYFIEPGSRRPGAESCSPSTRRTSTALR